MASELFRHLSTSKLIGDFFFIVKNVNFDLPWPLLLNLLKRCHFCRHIAKEPLKCYHLLFPCPPTYNSSWDNGKFWKKSVNSLNLAFDGVWWPDIDLSKNMGEVVSKWLLIGFRAFFLATAPGSRIRWGRQDIRLPYLIVSYAARLTNPWPTSVTSICPHPPLADLSDICLTSVISIWPQWHCLTSVTPVRY